MFGQMVATVERSLLGNIRIGSTMALLRWAPRSSVPKVFQSPSVRLEVQLSASRAEADSSLAQAFVFSRAESLETHDGERTCS
jgi:hypothetical protein